MNSHTNNSTPAQQLVGKRLPNGWMVTELIDRPTTATGGSFSTSYIVRSDTGEKAFLKAMDYRKALKASDPATALETLTVAYNFERTVLEKCKARRLSRIVRVLDSGTLPAEEGDPSSVVQYLILELAKGDIRSSANWSQALELAWALRTMHEAAAALQQLHSIDIAHQDVKPSNIVFFESNHSKLTDLGRASDRHKTSPQDTLECAGDPTYAPPELLYGFVPQDWRARRLGCDLYLLGSLLVFLCGGVSMTHLLFDRLDKQFHPQTWSGTYQDVMPYLQQVFVQILREFREKVQPDISDQIVELVNQLCNLDPMFRGHPKNTGLSGTQYSLERYVSIFDRLAKQSEWSLMRATRSSQRTSHGRI